MRTTLKIGKISWLEARCPLYTDAIRNPHPCKKLLEVILDIQIARIDYPEEQKTIDIAMDARGIRLDVYVQDEDTVYNIEMQTTNTGNLPKRSRYYQGMIDLNLIEKGDNYNNLKKSFVIFICTGDIFGKGRHIYTFQNLCVQEPTLCLNDETTKVFLNPLSDMDDVDEELKNFLLFVASGKPVDDFTRELSKEVDIIKTNERWEAEYMTLKMIERERYAEGLAEGRAEGHAEGLAEGILNTLKKLVQKGHITIKEASEEAGMTQEEFKSKVLRCDK